MGYSPWGCKDLDTTEQLTHTHTHTHTQSLKEHTISLLDAQNLNAKCCTLSSLVLFLCRFSQGVIGGLQQKVNSFFL